MPTNQRPVILGVGSEGADCGAKVFIKRSLENSYKINPKRVEGLAWICGCVMTEEN